MPRTLTSKNQILVIDSGTQQYMTLIKNIENGTVDVYSQLITDFDSATQTLTVNLKNLSSATNTTTSVSTTSTDLWGNKYVQLTVADGVYEVEVKISASDGTELQSEKACLFMDCDMVCDLAQFSDHMLLLHYSLTHIERCRTNCSDMANIYIALRKQISDKKLCGCSKL